jgi:hypothetical protein
MENFNELFEQAAIVADRRNQIFNRLIEKTINDLLPAFCESCEKFDIKKVYFKTDNKVNTYCDKQYNQFDSFYVLCINVVNKSFCDAKYDELNNKYSDYNCKCLPFDSEKWLKTGIVEFVKYLNNRLADYIKKYEAKNIEAETLLK